MNVLLILRAAQLVTAMRVLRGDGGDVEQIAMAIAATDATDLEAEWLAAIAYRESTFEARAVGDHGGSFCWAQIHLPRGAKTAEGWSGADLVEDPSKCATVALRTLRASFARCARLPMERRLAAYARGFCESESGQRISRDRDFVRRRMFAVRAR